MTQSLLGHDNEGKHFKFLIFCFQQCNVHNTSESAEIGIFDFFAPVTLTLPDDLIWTWPVFSRDTLDMYYIYERSTSRLSKVIFWPRDTQTDTTDIIYHATTRVVSDVILVRITMKTCLFIYKYRGICSLVWSYNIWQTNR